MDLGGIGGQVSSAGLVPGVRVQAAVVVVVAGVVAVLLQREGDVLAHRRQLRQHMRVEVVALLQKGKKMGNVLRNKMFPNEDF